MTFSNRYVGRMFSALPSAIAKDRDQNTGKQKQQTVSQKKKKKVKGYRIHNRALLLELSLIKINEKHIFKLHVAQTPCSSATNKKQNTKL